ncbi:MAG: hypothetical protein V2I56_04490 [Desulfobacteraceae bacterium]|nr:hypothetical protein [Desulfobacteraceae bacterium]
MTTKNIVAATILLLFLSTPCTFAETSTASAPKAVLPESIHVFEPVVEGTLVSHDFILQNLGDAPLIIESIKAG